jgi:predicted ATP-grasp superfamily ATP-dependent carboligase
MRTPGALITGGDFQGLGLIRSLGRRGIPVHVIDHERSIARFSRFCGRFSFAPSPGEEQDYISFLIEYARGLGPDKWVLYAHDDAVVKALAKNKKTLENHYMVPTPGWEVIQYAYDKKQTYQLAESLNIPIPKTYYPQNAEDIQSLDLKYPVVIKPTTRGRFFEKFRKKAILIHDQDQLLRTYRGVCHVIDPAEVLIQEFIPSGPSNLYSFCPFFKEGRALSGIMARRARQHPMDFGHATTFAEVVHIPELEEYGNRFLSAIDYYGPAEVEFMYDPRDGTFKFLEVNARFWGWHTLAIGAGIDFPYILYQDTLGQPLDLPSPARPMKWLRTITDVPTAALEIAKGRLSLGEYVSSLRGEKTYAVFAMDDPLPFIMEYLMIPHLLLKRGF